MTFNYKHFLVQTAIVGTLLSPIFLQSCKKGEGPLPEPPEPPVVVDPPVDDPYAITDTIALNLKASDVYFSIAPYGSNTGSVEELDAPIITTEGMNFFCTTDANKAIGEVACTISFKCPPEFDIPGNFDNIKVDAEFKAYGNNYFVQGNMVDPSDFINSGGDYNSFDKHLAVDEITIKNDFNSSINPYTNRVPEFGCMNAELQGNMQTGAASYFYPEIKHAIQEIFGSNANKTFAEQGFSITAIDEFGNKRNVPDAATLQFLSEANKVKDEMFTIQATFLIEKTAPFELGNGYVSFKSQNATGNGDLFIGVVPK